MFLLALICYWPALTGDVLWDDPAHITSEELRGLDGLWRIWSEPLATQQYYPVLHSVFWLEYQLWGNSVLGYHLANVFQHALAACLLAAVLRRLWSGHNSDNAAASLAETDGPRAAEWIAAILFTIHPVCVESVAWISEQKNTLSLVFYLLAALCYLKFDETRDKKHYLRASAFFVLALLSKTVTATLPAALLVVFWWKRGRLSWKADVVPALPWFGLALVAGLSTAWIEANLIGADGAEYELSFLERLLLAGRILWFYLGSFAWPVNLAFFYERWEVADQAYSWIAYLVAAIAVTFVLWIIRARTRGPLAIWLLFGGTLFPALGFFKVFPFAFSYVADHFQYLANLSLFAGVGYGCVWLVNRLPKGARIGFGFSASLVALLLVFASHSQSKNYRDNETLFRANVKVVPSNWMAHRVLAWALSKKDGYEDEALHHYEKAVELNPQSPDAQYGYGVMLERFPERKEEALERYRRALELRPEFAEPHYRLGLNALGKPGGQAEAMKRFEAALQTKPRFAPVHYELGNLLVGNPDTWPNAMAHYEEALSSAPGQAEYHHAYGREMAKIPPRRNDALNHLRQATVLDPERISARIDLGRLLISLPGGIQEAKEQFRRALDLDAINVEALNGIAIAYAQEGDFRNARQHWERALEIDPSFELARQNLSRLEQLK